MRLTCTICKQEFTHTDRRYRRCELHRSISNSFLKQLEQKEKCLQSYIQTVKKFEKGKNI